MNRRPSQSRSGFDSFSPQHTAHFKAAQPGDEFFEPRPRAPLGRRVLVFLLLLLLAALAANLAINQFVQVARVTVPIRKMDSALEGYTLLHISDLKGASYGANQSRIRFALQKEDFDAVVLTGDMVSSRGNAQPLYTLIEMLHELKPGVPIYMIPGDKDPLPASMSYAASGSPFAPWVLGARRRGAQLLSAPVRIERDGHTLWLTTSALLSLDMDTMQEQFERQYLDALSGGDENAIELTAYNLQWLIETRDARAQMTDEDVYIALTHVPPADEELEGAYAGSLRGRLHLVLCGHYQGGLVRLPFVGALFIPSQNLPFYGILPGKDTYYGLTKKGGNLSVRLARSRQQRRAVSPAVLPPFQSADGFADFADHVKLIILPPFWRKKRTIGALPQ